MIWKLIGGLAPVLVGGAIFSGALSFGGPSGGGDFLKTVDASPAAVAGAIGDIDFDAISQGETAAIGRLLPKTRRQTNADGGYTWQVMSGDNVAMELVAALEPAKDGTATRISGTVRKGADGVPPGPHAPEAMKTFFAAALEAELNEFAPPEQRFTAAGLRIARAEAAAQMSAIQAASNPMAIAAHAAEEQQSMRNWEAEIKAAEAAAYKARADRKQFEASGGRTATFEPGKPMIAIGQGGKPKEELWDK